jgi:hypothetical protein
MGKAVSLVTVTSPPIMRVSCERSHRSAISASQSNAADLVSISEGEPIGVVTVAGASPGAFSDRQVELPKTFADQAVIAIENLRLFEAEQQLVDPTLTY